MHILTKKKLTFEWTSDVLGPVITIVKMPQNTFRATLGNAEMRRCRCIEQQYDLQENRPVCSRLVDVCEKLISYYHRSLMTIGMLSWKIKNLFENSVKTKKKNSNYNDEKNVCAICTVLFDRPIAIYDSRKKKKTIRLQCSTRALQQ